MRYIFFLLSVLLSFCVSAQVPTYYNDVNLTLTGLVLKTELSQKITNTHLTQLQYTNVWGVLQQTDLDPSNTNNVLLLYGFNDGDGNPTTDRTRDKNNNGGNFGEWNREHTYAQSLATPNMITSVPNAGTDAHHLRSTDVQMNSDRGNRMFAIGSGNAGNIGANWYPGNEWRGDVARMMMYMYLRYPTQCLPNNVGVGTAVGIDPPMIDLFLQWNAADNPSIYEQNRNTILETQQGNRNPFIDNPYLATIIWGGSIAQDNWNLNSINESINDNFFKVYPVPSKDGSVNVYFEDAENVEYLTLYSINGEKIQEFPNPSIENGLFSLKNLPKGFFILRVMVGNDLISKKIIVN